MSNDSDKKLDDILDRIVKLESSLFSPEEKINQIKLYIIFTIIGFLIGILGKFVIDFSIGYFGFVYTIIGIVIIVVILIVIAIKKIYYPPLKEPTTKPIEVKIPENVDKNLLIIKIQELCYNNYIKGKENEYEMHNPSFLIKEKNIEIIKRYPPSLETIIDIDEDKDLVIIRNDNKEKQYLKEKIEQIITSFSWK